MILLLPPSETKAAGGTGASLTTASLGFPRLAVARARALAALDRLVDAGQDASTPAKARAAAANAAVRTAPTMPAIERYRGVLFDGIGVAELPAVARRWLDEHVVVQSALFGFVRASDAIPEYKVSATTRLPGERMRALWADAGAALEAEELVVDLRSKAYAELAPVAGSVPVEVVGESGAALNHWNKHGKGVLVRRLAHAGVAPRSATELAQWAAEAGVPLFESEGGLRLVARDPRTAPAVR